MFLHYARQLGDLANRDEAQCRICFGHDATLPNPLGIVCRCRGTQLWVHLACFKRQLERWPDQCPTCHFVYGTHGTHRAWQRAKLILFALFTMMVHWHFLMWLPSTALAWTWCMNPARFTDLLWPTLVATLAVDGVVGFLGILVYVLWTVRRDRIALVRVIAGTMGGGVALAAWLSPHDGWRSVMDGVAAIHLVNMAASTVLFTWKLWTKMPRHVQGLFFHHPPEGVRRVDDGDDDEEEEAPLRHEGQAEERV